MENHVYYGGRLIARLYERADGRVTVDLSPARMPHTDEACDYSMPQGLAALDAKYGGGSFKTQCDVDVARETVLHYARMEDKTAAAV